MFTNVGVQSDQDENCQIIVRWIAKRYHYLSSHFLGGVRIIPGPKLNVYHRAIIFLPKSVTKHYSFTLKIIASVLHGLR